MAPCDKDGEHALPAPVAPDGCFFLRIHISFSLCITSGSPNCCDFEEEGRRHRIAFNSLYLFSFRSIIYEANGDELYNFTRGVTVSRMSNRYPASTVSGSSLLCTLDNIREALPPWHVIYPDWLVLSTRLLVQPSCGQVKIVQYIYICLVMFPCGYVRILQPVAICTVIFVTPADVRTAESITCFRERLVRDWTA